MLPKKIVVALSLASCLALPPAAFAQASRDGVAEDMVARSVFQVLLGEFALQRGDARLALEAWADLAERTGDPQALARATEIAGFAGRNDLALALAERWRQAEPESTRARQAEAALLIQAGRIDELGPQLAALLAQDKENLPGNLLHLNRTLARIQDKNAVLELVDRLTAPYLDLPEAHFALTQAALAAGQEPRALTSVEQALRLRPDWEIAAIARAQIQSRQSNTKAFEDLQAFVKRYPEAREARLALARLLIGEKRYDEALGHYDALIKASPDDPALLYPGAMLALQQNQREIGRDRLERLLKTPFPDRSTIHFLLGQIAQEAGEKDKALGHFQQVTSGERYVAARARSAQLLLELGRGEEARALLHETRGTTPGERTQLVLSEAQLLREAGRHDEAYATLDKALTTQPDDPELLYDAALSAERIGKHEQMETWLKRLLTLQPDHAHALNALGYSLADRNIRLPEAETLIGRANKLAPEDPFILDSLGWVQYRRGRIGEALDTLQRAYRIKPDPEIAAHLGEVLWIAERRDEARRIWLEARQHHPDNSTLADTLKKFLP
ncbi:tetratricopeptide repeat protein [Azonexus sp. R2A61]|uniref:tetratricopeptide repeat protein n=1 Tax=Azonexus sp. R2A61 TaxID=2744443 RepID=UPI001F40F3E1|nr:tetratricopeptide repeat protein [Azonexus sp. R2A61]